jgi:secreted trypsin-like serine protease
VKLTEKSLVFVLVSSVSADGFVDLEKSITMEWLFSVLLIWPFLSVTVISAAKTNQLEPSERIAGGVVATPNEFPWMAYLMLHSAGDLTRAICAGTLINRQWILTDSSCVNTDLNQFVLLFKFELKVNSFIKF